MAEWWFLTFANRAVKDAYPPVDALGNLRVAALSGCTVKTLPANVIARHFDGVPNALEHDGANAVVHSQRVMPFNVNTLQRCVKRRSFEIQSYMNQIFAIGLQETQAWPSIMEALTGK